MKKLILIITSFVYLLAIVAVSAPASADNAFNYTNYPMNDTTFLATATMTAQGIQTFLQQQGSGLASFSDVEDCGSPSGSHYSYYAMFYSCGHSASAAQIISSASQAYGINPQVVLATLQKEQSLITTPNPTASQLNYAMGYGCPDSGGCSVAGFFNQVDNGTWQFRDDLELASGHNYWGYTPSNYLCNGPTRYYSAALLPGNTVGFKDDHGTTYTTFVIPNASTAALYCYTPHVYPGSVAEYYSGSYNFVYYFNLWFRPYDATYYNQSPNPFLKAGQSTAITISYKNTGSVNWYDESNAGANGTRPVHLAVTNPINSTSPFSYTWPSSGRAAYYFSAVLNSDGTLAGTNQHIVQPGQIAQFTFNVTVPWGMAPGVYRTYFQPVHEDSPDWNMGGISWVDTAVLPTINSAQYYNQTPYPSLKDGQSAPYTIKYKNNGNTNWYDDVYAGGNGVQPVHLAVTNPINSNSSFGWGWPSLSRPDLLFGAVYNADGVTLSTNQHVVLPGQIAEFDFNITVPFGYPAGSYTVYFQPVLEGSPSWNMGGVSWVNVNVLKDTYVAQYAGQAPYPSLSAGQSSSNYVQYKNAGNTNWYDNTNATSNNALPVHLAVTNPINSASPFSYTWPSSGRAALTFSGVYNADGVTLSGTDQHIVQPGQIARFTFNMTAPWSMTHGVYRTYFQPILEGSPNWNMGGVSWIDTTVQ